MLSRLAFILLLSVAVQGCTSWIAGQIVTAPGPDGTNFVTSEASRKQFSEKFGLTRLDFEVGPPRATIAASIIEPRKYELEYEFHGYEDNTVLLDVAINGPEKQGRPRAPDKGTVLVLPGLFQSRYTMVFWGIGMAERGYRVVLADLRGHGESSGRYLTYGIVESQDTLQILEALESKDLLQPPVVLLGASYGASTALMAAARSDRIDAVVALEPYADAASAIGRMGRVVFPLLSPLLSTGRMDRALDRASMLSGVPIREARPIDVMARIKAPVLLVHGEKDTWVPPQNSIDLFVAGNGRTALHVIPDAAHMDLPMRYDEFSERVFDWLDEALASPDASSSVTSGTREDRPDVSS